MSTTIVGGNYYDVYDVQQAIRDASGRAYCVRMVKYLFQQGKLPGVRIGRAWYAIEFDLRRFIENRYGR